MVVTTQMSSYYCWFEYLCLILQTEAEHNLQRQTDDNTQNNEVSPKLVSPPPPRDR